MQESKESGIEPLYTDEDVNRVLELFEIKALDEDIKFKDFVFSFHYAGHILGACFLKIQYENRVFVFSGDLGREDDALMKGPASLDKVDYLVLESTYGDREHPSIDKVEELKKAISPFILNKGVIIIPTFAVGRLQTMAYLIDQLFDKYPELKCPVFVDSPMGQKASEIYLSHLDSLKVDKGIIQKALKGTKEIEWTKQVQKFRKSEGPKILLSSSGMLTGGKVMEYLPSYIKHKENLILLTGFQSPESLGGELLRGTEEIKFEKQKMKVRAEVIQLKSLSSHADRKGMLDWVKASTIPRCIFLNHGEHEAKKAFKEYLVSELAGCDVVIPKINEWYEI